MRWNYDMKTKGAEYSVLQQISSIIWTSSFKSFDDSKRRPNKHL